jgi:hypothetical protein
LAAAAALSSGAMQPPSVSVAHCAEMILLRLFEQASSIFLNTSSKSGFILFCGEPFH